MASPMTTIGIVHTLLSLPPVIAGLWCFFRQGKIDPKSRAGKVYLTGLVLSVFSSFALHWFTPIHALGIVSLLAAFGGWWVLGVSALGRARPYLSAFGLTFSFFLLNIPAINESLSRLPPSHPIGAGPTSPPVQHALMIWTAVFVIGAIAQQLMIHRQQKHTA